MSLGIFGAGLSLMLCLWLRQVDAPVVAVVRSEIRLVIELLVSIGVFFITMMVALVQRATTENAETRLALEQQKSDSLLLNILPEPIATRLKTNPASIADGFDDVTVMFADLVGFTPLSKELSPKELVALMDRIFSEFDRLADHYGLEKIKTIGDAYMVAGGLPAPSEDHTAMMAEMALEMIPSIDRIEAPEGRKLNLRIGIARGAAVAGIIGRKKFSYDLWGDTVNTASRMESHGLPGQIQVNEAVWTELQGRFSFDERGSVEIKGQGSVRTWFLTGPINQ